MRYDDTDVPWITVESFDFTRGVPAAPTVRLRTENLNVPTSQPQLRGRTGLDADVRDHVLDSPAAATLIGQTVNQARALLDINARKNLTLHVLVGDDDRRTSCVVLAEAVAEMLRAHSIVTETQHTHLEPPGQKQPCPGPL